MQIPEKKVLEVQMFFLFGCFFQIASFCLFITKKKKKLKFFSAPFSNVPCDYQANKTYQGKITLSAEFSYSGEGIAQKLTCMA